MAVGGGTVWISQECAEVLAGTTKVAGIRWSEEAVFPWPAFVELSTQGLVSGFAGAVCGQVERNGEVLVVSDGRQAPKGTHHKWEGRQPPLCAQQLVAVEDIGSPVERQES